MEHKCNSCGEEFDYPEQDGEDFVCPFCGSVDWEIQEYDCI